MVSTEKNHGNAVILRRYTKIGFDY